MPAVCVYLGDKKMVGAVIEEYSDDVLMSLLAGNVQCCVEVLGRGVRRCSMLQQQQHVVGVAQPSRYVQRRLLLLVAL